MEKDITGSERIDRAQPGHMNESQAAARLYQDYVSLERHPNSERLHQLNVDLSSLYGNVNLSEEKIAEIIEKKTPPADISELSKVNIALPKLIINEEYPKSSDFSPRIMSNDEIHKAAEAAAPAPADAPAAAGPDW